MKALKKIIAALLILCLSVSFQLVASADDEVIQEVQPVQLMVDTDAKSLTVKGTLENAVKGTLIGMVVYTADKDPAAAGFFPDSIMETEVNAFHEYRFPAIFFGANSGLKLIRVKVDIGDELVEKEAMITFEDADGGITNFMNDVSQLPVAQVVENYETFASFAGFPLKDAEGAYTLPAYQKLVEKGLKEQLADSLLSDISAIQTKADYAAKVKEDIILFSLKHLEYEDLKEAIFTTFQVVTPSSDPLADEVMLKVLSGRDYADEAAFVSAYNALAAEDTSGTGVISNFSDAVAQLTPAQLTEYYADFAKFAGLTLKNDDGTFASETYQKLTETPALATELTNRLLADVASVDDKATYVAKVKEDMILMAVKYLGVADLYQAIFTEFNVATSTNPGQTETVLDALKGQDYATLEAFAAVLNEKLSAAGNGGTVVGGGGTVNNYTPIYGGGGGGGGAVVTPVTPATPAASANGFTDLAGHWSENDVKALADKKIINGYEDKSFRPDNGVTRAEAASIIKKAFAIASSEEKAAFSDVSPEEWYYTYINDLYQAGILKGDGDAIRPQGNLTRQDMCVLIYRCLQAEAAGSELAFSDADSIADYAKEAIAYLAANEIVSGYNNEFMPQDNITRGQLCAIVNRTLKAVNTK